MTTAGKYLLLLVDLIATTYNSCNDLLLLFTWQTFQVAHDLLMVMLALLLVLLLDCIVQADLGQIRLVQLVRQLLLLLSY